METPFIETEILLALTNEDGGERRARELLQSMLPGELIAYERQTARLHELVAEELSTR